MTAAVKPFMVDAHGSDAGREWARWKRNFNYFVEFNNVRESGRKKQLLLLLGGDLLQELHENLPDATGTAGPMIGGYGIVDEYKALVTKLDEHFDSALNVTVERHIFNQMRQTGGETIEQFAIKLRTQAKRCEFGDQTDSCIRDRVIAGCTSTEFRRDVLKFANASLVDVLNQAKIAEAVEIQTKAFKAAPSYGASEAPVNRITDAKVCGRCGRAAHSKPDDCPAVGKTCFKCGKTGHFQHKCCSVRPAGEQTGPTKRESGNQRHQSYNKKRWEKSNQHQRVSNVNKVQDNEPSENGTVATVAAASKDSQYIFCINGAAGSASNRIAVKVGGVAIGMTIDSGSKYNIIDHDSWQLLKNSQCKLITMTTDADQQFKGYGGNQLEVRGMVEAVLEVGDVAKVARFYVVKQKGSPLLGLDSAIKFGVLRINTVGDEKLVSAIDSSGIKEFNAIKDVEVELSIDPNVTPVWQHYRRVPVALEKAVDLKIKELLDQGIIEPVIGPTKWVSPLVIVSKGNTNSETGEPEVRKKKNIYNYFLGVGGKRKSFFGILKTDSCVY